MNLPAHNSGGGKVYHSATIDAFLLSRKGKFRRVGRRQRVQWLRDWQSG